ncbi:hypothetical protein JW824_14410 [bacterium]|nr:hypothetical protein [bacterium]
MCLLLDEGRLGFSVEVGESTAITEDHFDWFDPGGYFARFHVYVRLL